MKFLQSAAVSLLVLSPCGLLAQSHGVAVDPIDHSVKPGDKPYLPPDKRVHIW